MGFFGTKSKSTLTDSSIKIPDINNMPESERPIFKEDLAASTTGQKIFFGFRVVDLLDPQGEEILKSFAKAVSFLPEYAIQIEGHSNLAKSEEKLTAADKARTQKLSEDRADACARFLKAANVQNEITCKAMGPLKGETKGCVRLVLSQKTSPPEAAQATEIEHPRTETTPSFKDTETIPSFKDTLVRYRDEEASFAPMKGTDAENPADVEETDVPDASDSSSGKSSSDMDPLTDENAFSKENGGKFKDNEGPSVIDARNEDGIPEPSAPAQYSWSWYLPWGIACCKPKEPQSKDQEVVVKQRLFYF